MKGNRSDVYNVGGLQKILKFVRPQEQKIRLKTKSCFCISSHLAHQDSNSKVSTDYSKLAAKSLQHNYNISNLRPFSPNISIKILDHEISSIKIIQEKQKPKYYRSRATIKDKLKQFLLNSKNFQAKKQKDKLIQSSLQDQYLNLVQDYDQEAKFTAMRHKLKIKNINDKIFQAYPYVKFKSIDENIISTANHQQKIGPQEKIKSKSLQQNFGQKNKSSQPMSEDQGSGEKLYYQKYLKSYNKRKHVLNSSRKLVNKKYNYKRN